MLEKEIILCTCTTLFPKKLNILFKQLSGPPESVKKDYMSSKTAKS